eukprot:symbB.v1.2.029968.t1/scaffold3311.1/size59246/1
MPLLLQRCHNQCLRAYNLRCLETQIPRQQPSGKKSPAQFGMLSLCGLGLETSNLIGALPEPILPEIKQEFPPENAFALQRDAQNMDGL